MSVSCFFLLFYCQNSLIGDLFLMCFPCSVNKQEDLLPRTLICLRNKESFLIFMWEIMRVGHVIKFKIDCIGITFSLKSKNDSLLRIITIFFKHGEYHLNFWHIYITFIIKIRLCSNSVVYLAHTFIFLLILLRGNHQPRAAVEHIHIRSCANFVIIETRYEI